MRDKGYGRIVGGLTVDTFQPVVYPRGIGRIGELPNVTAAMERRGWPDTRIRKVLGENWVSLLQEVWDE
jgi:membrane dipeptidase